MVVTLGTVATPAGATHSSSTVRASVNSALVEANDDSTNPAIAGEGRYVAFESRANNLAAGDMSNGADVFLRNAGGEELVTSFNVPANDADGVQTVPLLAGTDYRIKVTGTYKYGNLDPGFVADAECSTDHTDSTWKNDRFASDTSDPTDDPLDLYVSDGVANDILEGPLTWQPSGDTTTDGLCAADPAHTYEYRLTAQVGGPLTFKVYDFQNYWLDNSGSIQVKIYKKGPTGPPLTTIASAVHLTDVPGNGASYTPSISADSRVVAFASDASNLPGPTAGPGVSDTNSLTDIYVRYTDTKEIERVSVGWGGLQPNGPAYRPAVSGDGVRVAFDSTATNIRSDLNPPPVVPKVWMRSIVDNWSWLVATCADNAAVSMTAEFVAYLDCAGNVIRKDTWGIGSTMTVSIGLNGTPANGLSNISRPAISADGRYVAFASAASNLVPNDTNGVSDMFVRDMLTGTTSRVSVALDGTQGNGASDQPAISSDGRWITFRSAATNLVPGDGNGQADVFIHDTQSWITTALSGGTDGADADGPSAAPSVSRDGGLVAFASTASNLVDADGNGRSDVFFRNDANAYPDDACGDPLSSQTGVPRYCESWYDDALEIPDPDEIYGEVLAAIGADRYADMWIERQAAAGGLPSMLRVGVVNPTPADELALDTITGTPDRVTTVNVKYSEAQLYEYRATMEPLVMARATGFEVYIDPITNKVVTSVDTLDPELVPEIFNSGVPADAFSVSVGYQPPEPSHGFRDLYPPYDAGILVTIKQTNGEWIPCTSAFAGKISSGQYMGLTGGHCDLSNQDGKVYMGWDGDTRKYIGPTLRNTFWPQTNGSDADALRFEIDRADALPQVSIGNEGSNKHRWVSAPRYTTGPNVGTRVCFQGYKTMTSYSDPPNCGDVEKKNVTDTDKYGHVRRHSWSMKEKSRHGDSGGPIYRKMEDGSAKPAGVLWGHSHSGPDRTWFSQIDYVLDEMGDGHGLIYHHTRSE